VEARKNILTKFKSQPGPDDPGAAGRAQPSKRGTGAIARAAGYEERDAAKGPKPPVIACHPAWRAQGEGQPAAQDCRPPGAQLPATSATRCVKAGRGELCSKTLRAVVTAGAEALDRSLAELRVSSASRRLPLLGASAGGS
jgi:hypothetical protein